MSVWIAGAAVVGAVGSAYSARKGAKAAQNAAGAQVEAAELGIEEQRRQFDAMQELLSPYVAAGNGALAGQQDILGLNGPEAQQAAIAGIESSPMFGAMARQGEDAILQNASATGGLRGGNTQAAIGQFRPQLLNQLLEQQYARLGGLTQVGGNAAAGVGTAGMQTGNNVTQLLGQQGAAQAGSALAQGRAYGQMANGITGAFGTLAGGFGGSTPPPQVTGAASGSINNTLF